MRARFLVVLAAVFLSSPSPGRSQAAGGTTTTQSQATTVLSQAAAALTGSVAFHDVTLTGTAERIAGGDDDTGSVTYKAIAGSSRLDLSLSDGITSEIRTSTANGVVGSWIDSSGLSHTMAGHNVMTDVGWVPLFTLQGILSSPYSAVSYIGLETRGTASLIHVTSWQLPPSGSGTEAAVLPEHLSQTDLYLDPTTFVPLIVAFNIHPDNDALRDIAIEIHFSDYRSVNGVLIPFHVQKFLSNGLYLDLQFQSAVINSGLTVNTATN